METKELGMSVVLVVMLWLSTVSTLDGSVVFESFESDPCWPYEGESAPRVPIDYWDGPEFVTYDSRPMMRIEPPNTDHVRVTTPFALEGDFTVIVEGLTVSSGNYLETHIKHYVGVYHAGITSSCCGKKLT